MRFAYADPPYIGQAKKHYRKDPKCAEVDHQELIERMTREYDGWALSLHVPSLKQILGYCPEGVRIAAWVKPFAVFKPGVNPSYSWEPVIFWGGRKRGRSMPTVRDFVSANITLKKGLAGAKPEDFCFWLFEVLNIQAGDEFADLFPGTGAVTAALATYLADRAPEPTDPVQGAAKPVQGGQYIAVETLVCRPGCGWTGEPEETTDDGHGGIACPKCGRTSLLELPDIEGPVQGAETQTNQGAKS